MSVLYPLTLRTDYSHNLRKRNAALKIFVFLMVAAFSFKVTNGQDEKAIQIKKEAEAKKLQEAQLIEKIKANPKMAEKVKLSPEERQILDQKKDDIEKSIAIKKEADEVAKRAAEKRNPSLTGIEYKVITTGVTVEYVITNNGQEIYRQAITAQGSLYSKQVQAEKEAIYASNLLRANPNYPTTSIQSQIRSLATAVPVTRTFQVNNPNRINADYTFNGGGGSIPAGAPTTTSGNASPYPATITVSGVPAGATVKEIKISGLNHTWPNDIDMVVQSPTGTNVYLMSDAGGSADLVNVDYTFSDAAATGLLDEAYSASGSYKPSNFEGSDNFPAPGPGAAVSSVTLSSFGNGNQNGTWNLFIVDDLGGDSGNWGSWSITFTDPPATCFPITITGQPANASICSGGSGTFSVTATPNGVSYNWQVNTGSGFTYLTNGGNYSGVNTATLTVSNPTPAMSGYQYRCVVTCSQGGLPEISNPATLTVLASPGSPAVTPTSASICPGGSQLIVVGGGGQSSFGGGPGVTIPGSGTAAGVGAPYPSTIAVAGLPAQTLVKSVTINGLTHTFPDDIDIILKSPSGATVILMSDAGGSDDVSGVNYTFDDAAATTLLDGAFNASGTYKPTNSGTGDNWPAPGPGTVSQTSPTLGSFGAGNNNGNWELYIYDDAGGDIGSITGWSITFEALGSGIFTPATGLFTDAGLTTPYVAGTPTGSVYASPAATTTYGVTVNNGTCTSAPTNVTITVNQPPTITTQPSNGNACIGSVKTFSVTATGAGLTYQWQVDAGSGYANITSASPTNPSGIFYSGQTTATLSINTLMATMSGYKYRVVVSGTCTPSITSNEVVLTVNSLPAISITKSSSCSPMTLTASGANTYSWSPSAGLSTTSGATVSANPTVNTVYTVTGTSAAGCVNTSQVDVKFTPPTPIIAPTAPIICSTAVQQLSVTSSSLPPAANTTSSGAISVAISDLLPPAISTLNVAGVTGTVQSISVNVNITHTFDGDITLNLKAPNGNIYNLSWENGGAGDNYTNTTFSSTASNIIYTGTPPYTGTFAAEGASGVGIAPNLSNVTAWSGLYSTPNGAWSLIVSDLYGGDNGTINSWSITINYATPDVATWTPATGLFTDAAGTTPYVAGTPTATVYASPTSTTTYSATVTNTSTETRVFSTGGTVTIPGIAPGSTSSGAGGPYPSIVTVSGLPANAVLKSVTVKGVKHSFPDDIDMLLQSPTGTNVVLMSDVGGSADATGQNFTFDDAAAGLMADAAFNASGSYKPTNIGASDTYPAPVGVINQATPTLASFTGNPNGIWNLYIADGASGDVGVMSSWELTFTIPTATNCTSAPRTVTVTVQQPITYTTQPQNVTACQNGTVTFTAAATGTITTTQWQQSTDGGATWANIAGATTTTLTLTNVQPSQNGYRYRLVLSNAGCGAVNSSVARLTVNPLPTVSLSLNPGGQTALRPGLQTTVTVNSSPAAATYQWFVNGVAQPQITGSSYVVDAYHLGTYTVRVTDVNGCVSTTAGVAFTAIPTSQLFVYPNPTTGAYFVTYYTRNPMPVTINVIDMKGRRIIQRKEPTTGPYTRFDFTADKLAAGVYVIEFRDASENLLATGRLVVTR